MKNYKKALFDAISDSTTTNRADLDGMTQNFIADYDATDSAYICDAITNEADAFTSIYYKDIKDFIINNFDAVEDAINEFGWDGCGRDLYKAGQTAEYLQNERAIYNELEDAIKYILLDFIDSTDDADDETESIWTTLTDDEKQNLLADAVDELEEIGNNDRLDAIADVYYNFVKTIKGGAENE